MKKTLLIIIAIFVLAVSAVGCGTIAPTTTPAPTNQQVAQPTYTPYPTQVPPTPYPTFIPYPTLTLYPTQVFPTPYPTQVPTPVPYRPSGSAANVVLLSYGFTDEGDGNYVWAATSDMYIKFMIFPDGGFKMFASLTGYNTGKYTTFISEIMRDLVNGGAVPYDAGNWLLANMPNAKDKPTMELNRLTLEDKIYINDNGVDFIEMIAIPIK
jgi:hypothetical protein